VPALDAIDRTGLDVSDETLSILLKVDPAEWVEAIEGQDHFLSTLGTRLARAIRDEHNALAHRIHDMITPPELRGRYR
jgi:phosphoenolpyruvate carboxykinase (GTP)